VAWRDERLLAVKPATVDRELRIISHLFTIAVKEWEMSGLVNPVFQIRKPGSRNFRPGGIGD
jgi:hypothetical protein